MVEKWEYHVWGPLDLDGDQREEYLSTLKQLGKLGWELVAVRNTINAGHPVPVELFFKKRLEED